MREAAAGGADADRDARMHQRRQRQPGAAVRGAGGRSRPTPRWRGCAKSRPNLGVWPRDRQPAAQDRRRRRPLRQPQLPDRPGRRRSRARYDKIHMFDVDLDGGERYRESAAFRPGDRGRRGRTSGRPGSASSICYDLRFPQLYRARWPRPGRRCSPLPAAFTVPTGRGALARAAARPRDRDRLLRARRRRSREPTRRARAPRGAPSAIRSRSGPGARCWRTRARTSA